MPLIIGACAGAGILLFGLIVLAIVLLSGGDDSSVADQKASPDQEHATSSGSSDSPSNTESDSPAGRSAYSTERVPVAHRATYGMTPVDGPSIVTSDPPPAEPYTPPSSPFKLLAGVPIELSFAPFVTRATSSSDRHSFMLSESGRRVAVIGRDRIAVIQLPDLKLQTEVGTTESPTFFAVNDKHLILIHQDRATIEIVDLENGKPVKTFRAPGGSQIHWSQVVRNRLICNWGRQRLGTASCGILDLDTLTVPPLVTHVAASAGGLIHIVPKPTGEWMVGGTILDSKLQKWKFHESALMFDVVSLGGEIVDPSRAGYKIFDKKRPSRLQNGAFIQLSLQSLKERPPRSKLVNQIFLQYQDKHVQGAAFPIRLLPRRPNPRRCRDTHPGGRQRDRASGAEWGWPSPLFCRSESTQSATRPV